MAPYGLRDIGDHQCGIVSFNIDHVNADDASRQLKADKINVSVSRPASTLLDARKRQLPDLIRASVHYFNDERELGVFIGKIRGIVGRGNA